MEQTIRLAEIEVSRDIEQERIVGLFRYQDEKLGTKSPQLLLMADIASSLYVYEQLLDTLNDAAERVYRQLSSTNTEPMSRFEKIVKRLNDAVSQFVASEPSEMNWGRVSLYVFEIHDKSLCVSGIGHLSNAFLQKAGDSYRTFDLFGSLDVPAVPDTNKLFSALVCGDMKPGDVFFAGTSNFERLRGELDLVNKLKSLPPVSAALEITQEIERYSTDEDFAGIVISCNAVQQRPTTIAPKSEPQHSGQSMQDLYKREKATEQMLSPSVSNKLVEKDTDDLPPSPRRSQTSFSFVALLAEFKNTLKQRKRSPLSNLGKDATTLAGMRNMGAGHGTALSKTRKRQLILLGATLFLIAIGGLFWNSHTKKQKALALWNTQFEQAQDRRTRAESSLLYGNEQGARNLLQEARTLANGLSEDENDLKEKKTNLLTELDAVAVKIRRNVVVTPVQLASASLGAQPGALRTPFILGGNIYAIDQSAQSIIRVDPSQTNVQRYPFTADSGEIVAAAGGATTGLLVTSGGNALSMNPTTGNTTSLGSISTSTLAAMTIYNRRLYSLNPQNGTLLRHEASGSGFGAGTSYIKQTSTPLTNTSGIAIDSSVYVSWSDGRIKRYLSGAEESWSVATVDPAVTSISSIWTDSANHDRIVATDPQGKRILVWRKSDGAFIAQLTSPNFQGPTYVTGDGEKKKLYVTDNNILWELDLP
ncbi:MAG TPA: hypothetical protein PLR08_00855 [bacterium]|nr:hypothetical protein [bacterium]